MEKLNTIKSNIIEYMCIEYYTVISLVNSKLDESNNLSERGKRQLIMENYSYIIVNKTVMNDKRLSATAKGIMFYLLSLPDDYEFNESELTKYFTDNKDSIHSGIKELIRFGYLMNN